MAAYGWRKRQIKNLEGFELVKTYWGYQRPTFQLSGLLETKTRVEIKYIYQCKRCGVFCWDSKKRKTIYTKGFVPVLSIISFDFLGASPSLVVMAMCVQRSNSRMTC